MGRRMATQASESGRLGYTRIVTELAAWDDGRTPDDGAPDRVIRQVSWLTPTGREVTSERRIPRLEARHRRRYGDGTGEG